MIRTFTVRNFRCFGELTIGNKPNELERVNLITGKNNSGKSALLEALFIFLAPNNPEVPLRLGAFRGIEQFRTDPDEMWGWLFRGKQTSLGIELKAIHDDSHSSSLVIRLTEPTTIRKMIPQKRTKPKRLASLTSTSSGSKELVLEYRLDHGKPVSSNATVSSDGGFRIERGPIRNLPTGIFLVTSIMSPSENADRFSKLEEAGRLEEIVQALHYLQPDLRRLSLLMLGGVPVIHGEMGVGRLVPLPYMGEGTRRLLSILLAIGDAKNGTVLIDEVENGFHYSVQKKVWESINQASKAAKVQIFATTHSYECIAAAHEAFADTSSYDLKLLRLERADGSVNVAAYDREILDYATEMSQEVR